jgi:polysaccharide export outer membrane protein
MILTGCGSFRQPAKRLIANKKLQLVQALPQNPIETFDYLIGPQDVLSISTWQDEDLNAEVIVRPDGKIYLRLIGEVQVAGKTLAELNEIINRRYNSYIKSPEILVTIKQFGGTKVIILGEVESPGVYRPIGRVGILEAIAMAGGFTDDAVLSSVIVIRGNLDNPEKMRLNLTKAITKTDLSQNIAVKSNDVIYVPKKFIANIAYFFDEYLGPILSTASTGKNLIRKQH